jgi:hypothetical protein
VARAKPADSGPTGICVGGSLAPSRRDGHGRAQVQSLTSGRLLTLMSRWRIDAAWIALATIPFARPSPRSIGLCFPMVVAGLGLRTWARGHLDRAEIVTQTGPFAFVRHPLYVGSFFVGLGVSLMSRVTVVPVLFTLAFLLMYWPKALREEHFLRNRFGDDYARYAERVGAVIPRLASPRTPAERADRHFQWRGIVRYREYETWIGTSAMVGVMMWRAGSLDGFLRSIGQALGLVR